MGKSHWALPVAVATLPIQLNKYFFINSSFVFGIPIDYLAISIYISDFAIFIYLFLFILKNHKIAQKIFAKRKNFVISIFLLNLLFFINPLIILKNPQTAVFFAIKFLEFSLFTLFASIDLENKAIFSNLKKIIYVSLFWQSAVVILQFIFQRSLNLWFLGERSFDASTPTIANSTFFGNQFLRPYGTFPHPNVAGAFFVIFLILLLPDLLKKDMFLNYKKITLKNITLILSFVSVCFSYSKTALFILLTLPVFYFKNIKKTLIYIVFLLLIILLFINFFSFSYETSVAERLTLFQAAYKIALQKPLFGVGSSNFIPELAKLNLTSIAQVRLLQPVHNVFLLLLTQNGIIGLILFANFLFVIQKSITSNQKLILFLSILIYLSVDHFLWTLQQGLFLMALAFAFILSSQKDTSN